MNRLAKYHISITDSIRLTVSQINDINLKKGKTYFNKISNASTLLYLRYIFFLASLIASFFDLEGRIEAEGWLMTASFFYTSVPLTRVLGETDFCLSPTFVKISDSITVCFVSSNSE